MKYVTQRLRSENIKQAGWRDDMSIINDGGPAFPAYDDDGDYSIGMSLRDYIAIHAKSDDIIEYLGPLYTAENRAKAKYKYADDMIKARKNGN